MGRIDPRPAAVIYLPDAGSAGWIRHRVAGVSVLGRVLMAAVGAGVTRIGLPRVLADPTLLGSLRRHPRVTATVITLGGDPDEAFGEAPLLLLPANVIVEARALKALLQAADLDAPTVLEESKGSQAPVLIARGEQTRTIWDRLQAGRPIGEELETWVRSGQMTLVAGDSSLTSVTDAGSLREVETRLYSLLGTDADSLVDRVINRRLSRWLTRLLIHLPVTPNQVSLASLGFGLASAWAFLFATPLSALVGLVLYMLSVVADHSDGEIARLTFQESALGRWLDVSVDTLINVLLVLGMAVTASTEHGPLALVGGSVAGFGIVMSSLLANFFPPRPTRAPRMAHLLRGMGNRDLFYLVLVAFIVSLWTAPLAIPILLGVLAVGSQVYWLTCLVQRSIANR